MATDFEPKVLKSHHYQALFFFEARSVAGVS